jgi:sodium/potassium-transporting ATPase subunit alpha
MDNEKEKALPEPRRLPENALETAQTPGPGGNLRIQFTPQAKPGRPKRDEGEISTAGPPTGRRTSIPQVITEKDRRKREKDDKKKNVDIVEHLMSIQEVSEKYDTRISIDKPGSSQGLTAQQVERLLQEHGPNVLTPPKKRHPFLKYLDSLRSLFNLLLIVAGVLEYILLGIDYHDNFQNVCIPVP